MVPMIAETNAMAEELGKKARYFNVGFYFLIFFPYFPKP